MYELVEDADGPLLVDDVLNGSCGTVSGRPDLGDAGSVTAAVETAALVGLSIDKCDREHYGQVESTAR